MSCFGVGKRQLIDSVGFLMHVFITHMMWLVLASWIRNQVWNQVPPPYNKLDRRDPIIPQENKSNSLQIVGHVCRYTCFLHSIIAEVVGLVQFVNAQSVCAALAIANGRGRLYDSQTVQTRLAFVQLCQLLGGASAAYARGRSVNILRSKCWANETPLVHERFSSLQSFTQRVQTKHHLTC